MLQKKYRLRKNIEFVATYAQKKYVSNACMTLNLGKQKPFEDYVPKVAFVVSKKIHKRAVKRNLIKRRMREAFKILMQENTQYTKWMSLIFTAKKECLDSDFQKIKSEMKQALDKAVLKYD